jgi:hypothetical protein
MAKPPPRPKMSKRTKQVLLIPPRKPAAKRRGPGRPKGSVNRTSIKFIEEAARAGGMLPHEVLLNVMRCDYVVINGTKYSPTFEQRMQAAVQAAPYFAPRLGSVDVLQGHSDEDLRALLVETLRDPAVSTLLSDPAILKALGFTPAPPEKPGAVQPASEKEKE